MCKVFWLENLKGRYHLDDLGIDGNIRMDLREVGWEGVDCLRIGTSVRPL
jgi:hypothetical protein